MRRLIIPVLTITLAACGSGGGGGSSTKKVYRPDGTLTGMVTDALVTNATVDFYRYTKEGTKEFLAESVKTDGEGKFTQNINAKAGYVLIVAKNGSYTEEESGDVINLGSPHELKALTYIDSGQVIETVPNPWSTVAVGYVECLLEKGESLENAVAESRDLVSAIIGVPVQSTYPVNPTYKSNEYHDFVDDGIKFGALAAGMSKWTSDEANNQGREPHSPGLTSIDLALSMYRDVQSDCLLDGFAVRPDGTKYNLAFGKRLLDANVYRTEIPRKMLEFMASKEKNQTRITSAQLALYANQQASSTAIIYGGQERKALDEQGPIISLSVDDEQYVYGQVKFFLNANDISGVNSVKVSVGGQPEKIVDGDNSKIEFASSYFEDGPIKVVINARDGLHNVTQKEIRLNIQNTKPIMNLKSKPLVKTSDYAFEMLVENMPQGIQSAFANGKELNVDGLYVWGKVPLKQGDNSIAISLLDTMDVRHEQSRHVFLDKIKPNINPRVPSIHPEEQFEVRYLPKGAKEPIWRNFIEKSEESIFVPRDRKYCGSTHLEESKLKDLGWPYVAIEPLDAGNSFDGVLRPGNFAVKYTYEIGDQIRVNKRAGAVKFGPRFVVPFCQEFLGDNWWEANDRGAKAKITFYVTDEAGNEDKTDFEFNFAESSTTLEPKLGDQVYIGGESDMIYFDSTGMEGIDEVDLYVDGDLVKIRVQYEHGRAAVPVKELKDGLHEAYFVLKDNGNEVLKTEPVKFRIDNTAPTAKLLSKPITGSAKYIVEFSADDGEGSGFDPSSLVVTNRLLSEKSYNNPIKMESGTYTLVVDLVPGINPLVFDFKDKVGNKQRMVFDNVGYDASAPALTWTYPDYSVNVFGYSEDDPINPVVLQPFSPTGMSYPLYLNDEMLNFKPTGQGSFQGFRPFGDDRVGWRPVIVPSVYDRDDASEWGIVGSDKVKINYEVYVGDKKEPVHTAEITEPRFWLSGAITVNREDMGNDFYRVNETTKVTVKVHLEDEVGHTSTYSLDFKVHFVPSAPRVTSVISSTALEGLGAVNIESIEGLNRKLTTHNFQVTNSHKYPILVNLNDLGNDEIVASSKVGRRVNKLRSKTHYERALVEGHRVYTGSGTAGDSGYVRDYKPGTLEWTKEPVKGIAHIHNTSEVGITAFAEAFNATPSTQYENLGNMPSKGATWIPKTLTKWKRYTNCHDLEPERCWVRLADQQVKVSAEFNGIYLNYHWGAGVDYGLVKARRVTEYESAPGFPMDRVVDAKHQLKAGTSTLNVNKTPTVVGGTDWYLLESGESINVTRYLDVSAVPSPGKCEWVYEEERACLTALEASFGGSVQVNTRVGTLFNGLGSGINTLNHKLEPIRLSISR